MLTENNQLQYFKSEDTRQPIAGNIPLDTLCAIDTYDEENFKETGSIESCQACFFCHLHVFNVDLCTGGYIDILSVAN